MSAVHRAARSAGGHMVSLNRNLMGRCEDRREDGARKPHNLILEEADSMPQGSSSGICAGTAERNNDLHLSLRNQHRRKHGCEILSFSLVTIVSVGTVVVL